MPKTIYLDYAAATPLDQDVLTAMTPYFSELFYNPSAEYMAAKKVRAAIDEARHLVAHHLGAKHTDIIFTAGGTEANNLAIKGIMEKHSGSNIVFGAIEHESVIEPAKNYDYKIAPVQADGKVNIEKLVSLIDDNTSLVSIMLANNEIGTIQPVREIAKLIKKIRQDRKSSGNALPIYFHTDACQAPNYQDIHIERLGVDLMTINGGKIYGPKQSGALYCSSKVQIKPLIEGGGQERGVRSGTEQVANIIGFAAALDKAQNIGVSEVKRMQDLQTEFIKQINANFRDVIINGSIKNRLPNNLHITLPGIDNERVIFALDERGIQVAAGSACSASRDAPSHVLSAIGLSEDQIYSSLRFSMGRATDIESVSTTVEILKAVT